MGLKNGEIMEMLGFGPLTLTNQKVISSKWSRIIVRSFPAIYLIILTTKMTQTNAKISPTLFALLLSHFCTMFAFFAQAS